MISFYWLILYKNKNYFFSWQKGHINSSQIYLTKVVKIKKLSANQITSFPKFLKSGNRSQLIGRMFYMLIFRWQKDQTKVKSANLSYNYYYYHVNMLIPPYNFQQTSPRTVSFHKRRSSCSTIYIDDSTVSQPNIRSSIKW